MAAPYLVQSIGEADLFQVANIHRAAFTDSALTKLGQLAVFRYYEWQLIGPHELTALGAYIDRQMIGFCFGGVFQGALAGFLQKNKRFLIGRVLTHPWLLLNPNFRHRVQSGIKSLRKSAKPVQLLIQPRPSTCFGILSLALDPSYQGLGVGRLLMTRAEEAAHRMNYSEMLSTIQPQNKEAVAFYERLQWQKVARNGVWSGQMRKAITLRVQSEESLTATTIPQYPVKKMRRSTRRY
jgi:ribosomal protein S18 acetylase RimI-like enzyme